MDSDIECNNGKKQYKNSFLTTKFLACGTTIHEANIPRKSRIYFVNKTLLCNIGGKRSLNINLSILAATSNIVENSKE